MGLKFDNESRSMWIILGVYNFQLVGGVLEQVAEIFYKKKV